MVASESLQRPRLQHNDVARITLEKGVFNPSLSDTHLLPPDIVVSSLSEAQKTHASLFPTSYPFATTEGVFLFLPPHSHITLPIQLIFLTPHSSCPIPHFLMVLGEASTLTLLEEYQYASMPTTLQQSNYFVIGRRAKLQHYKIHPKVIAEHIVTTQVEQWEESHAHFHTFTQQGKTIHDKLTVSLLGPHAECHAFAAYSLSHPEQSLSHEVLMNHQAPQCKSSMLYKGILRNNVKASFCGKVHVAEKASKTEAYQANHHLLLTPEAEATSRPELEIYADEIRCKHGATVGQLDEEALFYLCSRGITREKAVELLLTGFMEEIFSLITPATLSSHIKHVWEAAE